MRRRRPERDARKKANEPKTGAPPLASALPTATPALQCRETDGQTKEMDGQTATGRRRTSLFMECGLCQGDTLDPDMRDRGPAFSSDAPAI